MARRAEVTRMELEKQEIVSRVNNLDAQSELLRAQAAEIVARIARENLRQ